VKRGNSNEDGKMSDTLREKGARLAELITSAPTEAREKFHQRQQAAVDAEHQAFKRAYDQRNCYLCGDPLTSFDEGKPCAHWLLNPEGFRKKRHFALVTEKYGFHQLQSFLRWLAAQDGGPKNINDLPEEGTDKLREVTIRYKDLEWSFSCARNDFDGHGSGSHQSPHYHFQMRHGNRIVIRYNDFHVPFSDQDILEISAEMASPDLRRRWSHGEGMKDVFRPEAIDAMLNAGGFNPTGEGGGDVHFDYFIKADEGTTMSGDDIYALIEEAKASGVSLGTLLRRGKLPNVTVETYATPGPGVVEQKSRSGRGGKAETGDG
jgi:hypothetical protein